MLKTYKVNMIDVQDLDTLVQETYGRPYNFQQQDGCKDRGTENFTVPEEGYDFENATVPERVNDEKRGVSFKAWLERDPSQKLNTSDGWENKYGLELWWGRNFYPDPQMVLNDLHSKGLIEAGEYTINIDW